MVAYVIHLGKLWSLVQVRPLKLALAEEKIPNLLKYAQKWACDLGSANKTCPWETGSE